MSVQFGVALGHLISCPTPSVLRHHVGYNIHGPRILPTMTARPIYSCPHRIEKHHRAPAFIWPAINLKHRRPSDAFQRHVLLGVMWPNLASSNWCGGAVVASLMDLPAFCNWSFEAFDVQRPPSVRQSPIRSSKFQPRTTVRVPPHSPQQTASPLASLLMRPLRALA